MQTTIKNSMNLEVRCSKMQYESGMDNLHVSVHVRTKAGTSEEAGTYQAIRRNVGYAVALLVEALRYKPEGRGFDSRWSHWNFSVT
jgi:hypothetical protein